MTDHGNEAVARARKQAAAQGRAQGLETGWTVFSYLLAGMAAYGGIGWLIGPGRARPAAVPARHAGRPGHLDRLHHPPVRQAASHEASPGKEMTGDR